MNFGEIYCQAGHEIGITNKRYCILHGLAAQNSFQGLKRHSMRRETGKLFLFYYMDGLARIPYPDMSISLL